MTASTQCKAIRRGPRITRREILVAGGAGLVGSYFV